MSDYARAIDKAIAELAMAKLLGPRHGESALVQARSHLDMALDEARRQDKPLQIGTTTPGPHPGLF